MAVLVFMVVYYRFAGLVASVALLANLLLTVGFMIAVQATFTLPGLAGLVLMVGMAVDANVLIYERLREERERGASLALAIRNGYDRALPTIIDTHLTSIFTAIVLYVVGNDQLQGLRRQLDGRPDHQPVHAATSLSLLLRETRSTRRHPVVTRRSRSDTINRETVTD